LLSKAYKSHVNGYEIGCVYGCDMCRYWSRNCYRNDIKSPVNGYEIGCVYGCDMFHYCYQKHIKSPVNGYEIGCDMFHYCSHNCYQKHIKSPVNGYEIGCVYGCDMSCYRYYNVIVCLVTYTMISRDSVMSKTVYYQEYFIISCNDFSEAIFTALFLPPEPFPHES
jgi:hypothetical protein